MESTLCHSILKASGADKHTQTHALTDVADKRNSKKAGTHWSLPSMDLVKKQDAINVISHTIII